MPLIFWEAHSLVGWRRTRVSKNAIRGASCHPVTWSETWKSVTAVIPVRDAKNIPSATVSADFDLRLSRNWPFQKWPEKILSFND